VQGNAAEDEQQNASEDEQRNASDDEQRNAEEDSNFNEEDNLLEGAEGRNEKQEGSGVESSESDVISSESDEIGSEREGDNNRVQEGGNDNRGDVPVEGNEQNLQDSLRKWALLGVTKQKVNQLLRILQQYHPDLPADARTLLKTPRSTETYPVGQAEGEMWYYGVLTNLETLVTPEFLRMHKEITIDVGIDGVNAYGFRCEAKFWPIIGCLVGDDSPFIIGCYFGQSKPLNLETFLNLYCAEVSDLTTNGAIINGEAVPFSVRRYILDAEGRSFVKCVVGHHGTYGCERCCVRGVRFLFREVFTDLNAALRTDDTFQSRENPEHHHERKNTME